MRTHKAKPAARTASSSQRPAQEVAAKKPIVIPMGKIFAKADFEGVVKASYVQLQIVDQSDPQKTYQLFIGDKGRQWDFPWKISTVTPDYFLLALPAGSYRFQVISIPVGTTLASEPMDVTFDVRANRVLYLGTLKVIGVGEKIHLGGVPVMKPGFNYRVQVRDEHIEALMELRQRFPEVKETMDVRLMQVGMPANFELPTPGDKGRGV